MEPIGEFLKHLRESKKMSFREAKEKSGLSHSYIRYLEIGEHPNTKAPIKPTPDALKALATAYDYPYEELMIRAGYLNSVQYMLDLDSEEGGIRPPTIEEAIEQYKENQKRVDTDLKRFIEDTSNNLYFEHKLISPTKREEIIDMIQVLMKRE